MGAPWFPAPRLCGMGHSGCGAATVPGDAAGWRVLGWRDGAGQRQGSGASSTVQIVCVRGVKNPSPPCHPPCHHPRSHRKARGCGWLWRSLPVWWDLRTDAHPLEPPRSSQAELWQAAIKVYGRVWEGRALPLAIKTTIKVRYV